MAMLTRRQIITAFAGLAARPPAPARVPEA